MHNFEGQNSKLFSVGDTHLFPTTLSTGAMPPTGKIRPRFQLACFVSVNSKEDIVVGAPFYHASGVGGAIYIYYNSPQVSTEFSYYTVRTEGSRGCNSGTLDCHVVPVGTRGANILHMGAYCCQKVPDTTLVTDCH